MKKEIWIFNHYATNMFFDKGGRHFWLAEKLKEKGYSPTIFCASTNHISNNNIIVGKQGYKKQVIQGIPFVFLRTPNYQGNGKQRIINMLFFYRQLKRYSNQFVKEFGKPDIILASSVHPMTLIAGLQISKRFSIPCICEIRDLWPESLVAYGYLNKNNFFTKKLYTIEKWIYQKADSIVMTWEGGKQYILDQGWEDKVDISKIHHISNGIVLKEFEKNAENFVINDNDLNNEEIIKVVYTGSIRKVNNLGMLLNTAKIILEKTNKVKFFIYGTGDELEFLRERCLNEKITNVVFKGRVEKKYIPSILKKADINILHNTSTSLDKYGQSQNKLFEYLSAGNSIIQTYSTGFSVLDNFEAGITVEKQSPKEIAEIILNLSKDKALRIKLGENARQISAGYDFEILTNKLINVIENIE